MKHGKLLKTISNFVSLLALAACTGGPSGDISVEGIVITPGTQFDISLQGAKEMGLAEPYLVEFKQLENDFTGAKVIYNLTEKLSVLHPKENGFYEFVLNKDIPLVRPMLVTITSEASGVQLVDVLSDFEDFSAKPNLTSTLAYELIKTYPQKTFNQYSSSQFESLKSLIQQRIDQQIAESEHLSLTGLSYDRLTRHIRNGLVFNISFLNAIKDLGIQYCFEETTPPGLTKSMLPTGDEVTNYKFAKNISISSSGDCANPSSLTARTPFLHTNRLPKIDAGLTYPMPSNSISALEDRKISLVAAAFDEDGDFVEKNLMVEYQPRIIPPSRLACKQQFETLGTVNPGCPVPPYPAEKLPETLTQMHLSESENVDFYETDEKVQMGEALDVNSFPECTDSSICRTAYRYVYYLITDGSVRVPLRWAFRYTNRSSRPQFIGSEVMETPPGSNVPIKTKKINQDFLDSYMRKQAGGTVDATHKSICDSRGDDRSQAITNRSDNPWSCVVKAFDPDIDIDPLGSADKLYFSANNVDTYTELKLGSLNELNQGFLSDSRKVWPAPNQTMTAVYEGAPSNDCSEQVLDANGSAIILQHRSCAYAIYQITIDNAVKVSAESRGDLKSFFTLQVQDSIDNPSLSSQYIERMVEFIPIPPRMVRFDEENNPSPEPKLHGTIYYPPNQTAIKRPFRSDVYLSELLNEVTSGLPGNNIGYLDFGFIPTTNNSNPSRDGVFLLNSTSQNPTKFDSSPFLTQPRKLEVTANALAPTAANPAALNSLLQPIGALNYSAPMQFDDTCSGPVQAGNNASHPNGFVFELNAIDFDNVNLKPNEPSDPVYLMNLAHNYNNAIFDGIVGLEYCIHALPTSSLTFFQNYSDSNTLNSCLSWSANPPAEMQPVPVFYTVTEGGQQKVKKTVYHRLWARWKPRVNGKTGLPDGLLKDEITRVSLGGNLAKFSNLADRTEIFTASEPNIPDSWKHNTKLFALRKDHKPCLTFSDGEMHIVHEEFQNSAEATFAVKDENKAGNSLPSTYPDKSWSLPGREQVEIKTLGSRPIYHDEFLRLVPFIINRSPLYPGTLPALPVTWYSHRFDPDKRARVQLTSDPGLIPMKVSFSYKAASKHGKPFIGAVVIRNTTEENPTGNPWYFNLTPQSGSPSDECFPENELLVYPHQEYVAIATSCTEDEILNIASSKYVQAIAENPLLPVGRTSNIFKYYSLQNDNGGFDFNQVKLNHSVGGSVHNISFRILKAFYGATFSTAATTLNPLNGIYFGAEPLNTYTFNGVADAYVYDPTLNANPNTNKLGQKFYKDTIASEYVTIEPAPNPSYVPGSAYGHKSTLLADGSNNPAIVGVKPASGNLYDFGAQAVDWDYQATVVKLLANPTPDPNTSSVYYRLTNGNKISLYVRRPPNDPNGTPEAIIPFSTSDSSNNEEKDPFDVHLYGNGAGAPIRTSGPAPAGAVTLVEASSRGGSCISLPAGFPTNLATLNFTNLKNYKECAIRWQPANNDDQKGKVFYSIPIQDNPSSFGGKYPGLVAAGVPLSNNPNANGPTTSIDLQVEFLESNLAPSFSVPTSPSGLTKTAITNAPNSLLSSLGRWCTSPSENFPCADDQFLGSGAGGVVTDSAYFLLEDNNQKFKFEATDSNYTVPLKSLSSVKPSSAIVITNSGYESYSPPTWSSMSYTATPNTSSGKIDIEFDWKPTDAESLKLSTQNGFLIPISVSDQDYNPEPNDSSFPNNTDFVTKKKSSRIWVWVKAAPKNNAPTLFANRVLPAPASAKFSVPSRITLTAGQTYVYNLEINDKDVAGRLNAPTITDKFSVSIENIPTWISLSNGHINNPAPTLSTSNYTETHSISITPSNDDAGKIFTYNIRIRDPGDSSRGIAEHPDLSPGATDTCNGPKEDCSNNYDPPRVFVGGGSGSNTILFPLTISIVGKPVFITPNPTTTQNAVAYVTRPFNFPLSVNITREEEKFSPFFIGIDVADMRLAPSVVNPNYVPYRSPTLNAGIYVSSNNVLMWEAPGPRAGTGMDVFPVNTTKTIKLYGIRTVASGSPLVGCLNTNLTTAPPANIAAGERWLVRYNSLTAPARFEYCRVSSHSNQNELSATTLNLQLFNNDSIPTAIAISETKVEKSQTFTGGTTLFNAEAEFSEFKARCLYCSQAPQTSNITSIDGLTLTANAPSQAQPIEAQYSLNGINAGFYADDQIIKKYYLDTNPTNSTGLTPARVTQSMAREGETLKFYASLNSPSPNQANNYYYRWYVNGCFKEGGMISANTQNIPPFTWSVQSTGGGANNDCAGQYAINEPLASDLGNIIVRLTLSNGTESFTQGATFYDNAPLGYVWRTSVINLDPLVQTETLSSSNPSNPLILNSSNQFYPGDRSSGFLIPVTHNSKEYLAYTVEFNSLPMRISLRELARNGNFVSTSATPSMQVTCLDTTNNNSVRSAPAWMGIHSIDGKLIIAASRSDSFPIAAGQSSGPGKNAYTLTSQSCFHENILPGTVTNTASQSTLSESTVARYLAYSQFRASNFLSTYFATTTDPFRHNTSVANNYFFLTGNSASKFLFGLSNFWTFPLISEPSTVFQAPVGLPSEFADYSNNRVRKIVTYGQNKAFVLVGSESLAANSKGFILNMNLTPTGGGMNPNNVAGTINERVRFAKVTDALHPFRDARDCNIIGSPIDAAYYPKNDTLFVHVSSFEPDQRGAFVAVKNASTNSPTCKTIHTSTVNPPLGRSTNNTALGKVFYDPSKDLIVGLVSNGSANMSQLYVIDAPTEKIATREISGVIGHQLVYSQNNNAVYIFDNRRSGSTFPTLYRVW